MRYGATHAVANGCSVHHTRLNYHSPDNNVVNMSDCQCATVPVTVAPQPGVPKCWIRTPAGASTHNGWRQLPAGYTVHLRELSQLTDPLLFPLVYAASHPPACQPRHHPRLVCRMTEFL